MTTEARIGWGAEVQLSSSSAVAGLVEIGEVRSFNVPSDTADEHEVTHFKSEDRRKEFISGLIDGGEVTVTMNYVPGSASDLLLTDAAESGTTRAVRFIIPDQTGTAAWQITTAGFVSRYSPDTVEPNAPITATAVIRLTGAKSQAAETSEAAS
jgi:predicted secreted protein